MEIPLNIYGKFQGEGRLTSADGDAYEGDWKDGKRDGEGSFNYVNGDSYSGNWLAGQKSGNGTYVYAADGAQLSGRWEKGWMVAGRRATA